MSDVKNILLHDQRLSEVVGDILSPAVIGVEGVDDEDAFKSGRVWEVMLIRSGVSANNHDWTAEVLRESVRMFEGVKAFKNHITQSEERERPERSIDDYIGWYQQARYDETLGGVVAYFYLVDLDLRMKVKEAWELGNKNFLQFSIDALADGTANKDGGLTIKRLAEVVSVDVVTTAAAGGVALRLVASGDGRELSNSAFRNWKGTEIMNMLEILKKLNPAEAEFLQEIQATENQLARALVSCAGKLEEIPSELKDEMDAALALHNSGVANIETASDNNEEEEDTSTPVSAPKEIETVEEPELAGAGVSESQKPRQRIRASLKESGGVPADLAVATSQMVMEQKLTESGLPKPFADAVRERYRDKIIGLSDLTDSIQESRKLWASVTESGNVKELGSSISMGDDEETKLGHGLDGFFAGKNIDGVPKFNSLKEAYRAATGLTGEVNVYSLLRESYPSHLGERIADSPRLREAHLARLRESLGTASWAQILGDSVTRRMVAEYAAPDLQSWKSIVSDIVPVSDFRTQTRQRLGGYGTLSTVAQAGTYQNIANLTDEEVSYAATKRGGTDDLTIEMIANDDIGAIRRIPAKLGKAAARTLYEFVFDFIRTNPTFDADSVAVFHSSHGNTGTAALSSATLDTARQEMRTQAAYGDTSDILGLIPKLLLVPNELEHLAYRLVTSSFYPGATNENATTVNLHQQMDVLVVDYWTDANDWAVICDPANCPTIEIGFLEGREEPELFVQDMPTAGSMFDADKVTYKIRHIYGGDVIDYRGMWKGVVA